MKKSISIFLIIIFPLWILFNCYATLKNVKKVELFTKQITENNNWDSENSQSKWKYYNGILMYALLKTGRYTDFVKAYYNEAIKEAYKSGELDSATPARTLFYLNDKKYDYKINFTYNELLKQETLANCADNYKHKLNNPRWEKYPLSLDSLYMSLPFMLEYSNKNNLSQEKEIFKRLNFAAKNMKLSNGLYAHGISADGKTTNGVVWLRACGWYAMALVDIIELMPEGDEKEILKQQLFSFFDTMLKYQHFGMWKNIIYPKNTSKCNKYETSGSLMLAYSMLKSYSLGYTNNPKYALAGMNTFNEVVGKNLKKDKKGNYILENIYQSSSVYDVSDKYCKCEKYVKNDAKGIAPLILSSLYIKPTLKKLTCLKNFH